MYVRVLYKSPDQWRLFTLYRIKCFVTRMDCVLYEEVLDLIHNLYKELILFHLQISLDFMDVASHIQYRCEVPCCSDFSVAF